MRLLDRAGREVEDGPSDSPAALSVLGTIHLRTAIMAAMGGRASPAWDGISRAREVSGRLAVTPATTGSCSARPMSLSTRWPWRSNSETPTKPSAVAP